jgi:hypothetical protein
MATRAFLAHQDRAAIGRPHDDRVGLRLADGLAGAAAQRKHRYKGNPSTCHVLTLRASAIRGMTCTCLDRKCVQGVVP